LQANSALIEKTGRQQEWIAVRSEEAESILDQARERYAQYQGQPVLVEGVFEKGFEHSAIGGLWVDFEPDVAGKAVFDSQVYKQQVEDRRPRPFYEIPVRLWGTIDASPGGHGHLGGYPATLTAHRAEVVESKDQRKLGAAKITVIEDEPP
jgi:hypothetical protein